MAALRKTIALGLIFLLPASAWAAGSDPSAGGPPLGTVLLLLLCVAIAYIAAHLVVDRLQRSFLVISSLEYLLLGIALGPTIPHVPVFRDLSGLFPMIALAAGWMGLLRGMDLDLRHREESNTGAARLAMTQMICVGGGIATLSYLLLDHLPAVRTTWQVNAACAGFLGCCALTSGTAPIALLMKRYRVEKTMPAILERLAHLNDLWAIAIFGILFGVFREYTPTGALLLSPTEWIVAGAALGIVLGLLFTPFLGGEESANHRFLAMVGIITFASGAAYMLRISPIFVNLMLGIALVNTTRSGAKIRATLEQTQGPINIILLILAGALWRMPPWELTLGGIALFVGMRWLLRYFTGLLATWGTPWRSDTLQSLSSHGSITVAMAISFRIVYQGALVDVVYSIILGSVIVHDLVSPRVLRRFLVDVGDIKREVQA